MSKIKKFMDTDHSYIDKLWEDFLSADKDLKTASKIFSEFSRRIRLHIKLEDSYLFPRFDSYLGFAAGVGPTVQLYRDHVNILKLLTEVENNLKLGKKSKIRDVKKHLQ